MRQVFFVPLQDNPSVMEQEKAVGKLIGVSKMNTIKTCGEIRDGISRV
jgi:hypothetical protein